MDHSHLRAFLDQRVRDGVIRRVLGKWMKAGVLEEGVLSHPEAGVPQGGAISPVLSNVYLHEVLDVWFEHEVKPRLRGRAFAVRYADDAVLGFEHEDDARRVLAVLPKRKTAKSRFSRTLRRINDWCRRNRHRPVAEQRAALNRKRRGHDAYYGITGNAPALSRLRYEVRRRWRKWLDRRSNAARMTWEKFNRLLQRHPLLPARVVHGIYAA